MNVMHLFYKLSSILLLLFLISSCVPKEKIVYVQEIDDSLTEQATTYSNLIRADDLLRIVVSSENMQSVAMFNQLVGKTSKNDLTVNGQGVLQSYLVDSQGYINYPLMGQLKVSGSTRVELQNELENKLLKYVKDPVVDVRLINFKISVLGEVNRPGTFTVNDNRITLLQAIGLAGDLNIYGKRKNVLIIRDNNGVQTSARVDLTSPDFIYSPYYYLQQNDTVIIEPNGAQVQAAGFNRNISIWVSVASLLLSTIVVVINLTNN